MLREGTEETKKQLLHKLELVCNYFDKTQNCSQENAERIQKFRLSIEASELESLLDNVEALLSEKERQKRTEQIFVYNPDIRAPLEENKKISEGSLQIRALTSPVSSNQDDVTIRILTVTIESLEPWTNNCEYRNKVIQLSYEVGFYGAMQDTKLLKEFKLESVNQTDCILLTMLRGVSRRCFIEINRPMLLIQKQMICLSECVWFKIEEICGDHIEVRLNTTETTRRFKGTFSIGRMGTWAINDASLGDEHVLIMYDEASEWKIQNLHSARSSIMLHVNDATKLRRDSVPAWIYDGTTIKADEAIFRVKISSFPEQ